MLRKLFAFSLPPALALLIALSGCGGGGGGHTGTSGTTGTTGTTGTVPDAPGVVRDINDVPIVGALVTFYNASGTSLGTVTVGRTGQVGTPPSGATSFTVNVTSLKTSGTETYYDTYYYGSLNYDGTVSGCNAPLTSGAFASSVVFTPRATGVPPSPPNGCGSTTGS